MIAIGIISVVNQKSFTDDKLTKSMEKTNNG